MTVSAMADRITDNRAADAILSFIYPITEADMTVEQRGQFDIAVQEQLDYMDSAEGRNSSAVKIESVGDVSVTYAAAESKFAGGVRIAPAVYNRLMRCGLLTRWF